MFQERVEVEIEMVCLPIQMSLWADDDDVDDDGHDYDDEDGNDDYMDVEDCDGYDDDNADDDS